MKITVDVDCTPEEARAFLGLPDVQPMQAMLMQEVQERIAANVRAMDPQEMTRLWLSPNLQNFERLYEAFAGFGGAKRE
jgi:hypothetical protein